MRRSYSIASVLFLTVLAGCSSTKAQAGEPASDALGDKNAVVRLYTGWQTDPKAYTAMAVPLDGPDVTFDAVAQAAGGSVPEDAMVVVVPDDQQDTEIAEMMGGCFFGEPYRSGGRITLRPGTIPGFQLAPCLFWDALDQPIPNAEVEILLSDNPIHYSASVKLWVGNARLDENGRMQSPKASASCRLCALLFVVIHPDCGPVPSLPCMSLLPGGDHPFSVGALPKEKWSVFLDALGNPIPGASVTMFYESVWESADQFSDQLKPLDDNGRLCPPWWSPLREHCCFVVSDPNYGTAIVEPYDKSRLVIEPPPATCVVPLAPRESDANERSLRGTVVDESGVSVADAVVACNTVVIPGGTRLHAFFAGSYLSDKCHKVLTDARGQFVMHLPLADRDGSFGQPVPPDAKYEVRIEAPKELGLEPFAGSLAAGVEHTITMPPFSPGPKTFTGALLFQDEDGVVTDPTKLAQITLVIHVMPANGEWMQFTYSNGSWTTASELPFGIYSATGAWDGELHSFGPVEVTADSPQTVTLVLSEVQPAETMYKGRVIHGVTSEPIAQAFVMQRPQPSKLDADLSEERFLQLLHFGPEAAANGELLTFLEQDIGWRIIRTDDDGRFEIVLPTSELDNPMISIIAIRKDFLGAELQVRYLQSQADRTGKVPLPDMKLFPAGTVVLDPCVPEQDEGSMEEVRFLYATAADDPTPWLADLWATAPTNKGRSVFRTFDLPINNPSQSVYVPADVTLTLTMGRRLEEFGPVVIENVRLTQAEVLDLGYVEFPPAIPVIARVIDSAGKPLEGIAIRCLPDGLDTADRCGVTDVEGCVPIHVPPHSQGQLAAEYDDDQTETTVREGVAYQVGGDEDAGKEFVLSLSDEFLKGLRESQ
jgi:hypothetical protein